MRLEQAVFPRCVWFEWLKHYSMLVWKDRYYTEPMPFAATDTLSFNGELFAVCPFCGATLPHEGA